MKKTIWKKEIPVYALDDSWSVEITMPAPFHIIAVNEQHGKLMLWAIVRPEDEDITRRFLIYGTGIPIASDVAKYDHVSSVVMSNGALVLHIFNA